ncbi:sugar transferase [Granulicoccus phenolivorans]|uniref:sugar transferase n=1 Tax=Granulicoccus phenolivorans TaxID=266854 RepID=UPI00040B18DE|nr:sugar transferase [Granulicoccus phenolivorans]
MSNTQARRGSPRLTRHHRGRLESLALLTIDGLLIALANLAAVYGRTGVRWPSNATNVVELAEQLVVPVTLTWVLISLLRGAYRADTRGTGTKEYTIVLQAGLLTASLLSVWAYLFQVPLSRGYFALLFLIGIPLLLVGRVVIRRVIHRLRERGFFANQVVVVGQPQRVADLIKVLDRESWLGYQVRAQILPARTEPTNAAVPVSGTLDDIVAGIEAVRCDSVLFTEGAFTESADFRRLVWELEDKNVDVILVPGLSDISADRVRIQPVAGLPLMHVERPGSVAANRGFKRAFDLTVVLLGLLLGWWVLVAVAIAVKLGDGGPVLYRQIRVGREGKLFSCFKFRSMVPDAHLRVRELQQHNEGSGVLFKMSGDPRITRVGRFLRRYSLDELPQLFNVLRGEMSLIGPRPALPDQVARYDEDMRRRLQVRPGLTGLWQVSGRSDLSWEDTVRLDLYYVDNWSMLQDLSILGRTLHAVIIGRGAY